MQHEEEEEEEKSWRTSNPFHIHAFWLTVRSLHMKVCIRNEWLNADDNSWPRTKQKQKYLRSFALPNNNAFMPKTEL